MPLKPGDKAPTFTLLDQSGAKVKLSDFKGRKVLLLPEGLNQSEGGRRSVLRPRHQSTS